MNLTGEHVDLGSGVASADESDIAIEAAGNTEIVLVKAR
jgi:hypothetical protein